MIDSSHNNAEIGQDPINISEKKNQQDAQLGHMDFVCIVIYY